MLKNKKKEKNQNLYNFEVEKEKKKHVKTKEKKSTFINSDNEIIIGVTKYPDDKEEKKSKEKHKKSKDEKIKKEKKIIKKIKKEKKINEDDFNKKIKEKKDYKRAKTIFKIIGVTVVFIGVISFGMLSPIFNINEIIVNDNDKVCSEKIINLSEIQKGQNIFRINKNDILKKIKKNGYINNVKIKRKLPDKIELIIEERKATYMIAFGNGYVYINNQGYVLEISSEKKNLPIIQGTSTQTDDFKEGNRLNDDDLNKLNTILKIMSEAQVNNIESLITSIDASDENDYKIYFDTENKVACLGDCSNLETRMLYVTSILKSESGKPGTIFVNMNLNTDKAFFREKV